MAWRGMVWYRRDESEGERRRGERQSEKRRENQTREKKRRDADQRGTAPSSARVRGGSEACLEMLPGGSDPVQRAARVHVRAEMR
eukprot:2795364-Rhodomonas_salina.2